MIAAAAERRVLQTVIAVLSLIPIGVGLAGTIYGIGMFDLPVALGYDTDSLGRYLCGLLLAVGLAFLSTLPAIERQGPRFRLLVFLVVLGGIARLAGSLTGGWPSVLALTGLGMELVVTPLLGLWRERIERRSRTGMTRASSR